MLGECGALQRIASQVLHSQEQSRAAASAQISTKIQGQRGAAFVQRPALAHALQPIYSAIPGEGLASSQSAAGLHAWSQAKREQAKQAHTPLNFPWPCRDRYVSARAGNKAVKAAHDLPLQA